MINFDSPGDRVTVPVASCVAPNSPPKSSDPVVCGRLAGVNNYDGVTGDSIVLSLKGVYKCPVLSQHHTGIVVGETVYIDPTTAVLSDNDGGIPFGTALDPVALAATTTIRVRLFGATPGQLGGNAS